MVSGKPVSSTAYVVFNKIVSTSKEGVGFVITLILLSTGAKTTSGSLYKLAMVDALQKSEFCSKSFVFEGTHKPSGVFVIDTEQDCTVTAGEFYPYINDYLKRARVIAEAFRLPLVIYQKKTNRVQIITKDTYMKKPLQF